MFSDLEKLARSIKILKKSCYTVLNMVFMSLYAKFLMQQCFVDQY